MRIRWDELDHQKYEDMVSVLLSRLHPDAQRIDGKGGDGGRDVQLVHGRDEAILEAFELKSFTGRMDKSRPQQVSKSLGRAAGLKPVGWTLVVPIDPTPKELLWFRKLGDNYRFPIKWCGKTWLDEKMSAFPDIRRYFLEDAENEVVRLLRELQKEEAKITDLPDAVGRFRNLHARLNEIDPHYKYALSPGVIAANCPPAGVVMSVSFGEERVDVYPKHLGATKDRPITVKIKSVLGPEDETIKEALDFGLEVNLPPRMVESVTIDAPLGLGGVFTGGELTISPTITGLEEPVTLALDIIDEDRFIASWPLHLTERTTGPRGAILTGADDTGWLQVRLKIDTTNNTGEANIRLDPKPTMPAALLPLFQWLSALQPPKFLVMRSSDGSEIHSVIRKPLLEDVSIVRVVEALAYLQEASRMYWSMPLTLSREEESQIVLAASLLKGESIEFSWNSFSFSLKGPRPEVKELLEGKSRAFLIQQDSWLELEGRKLPIGRVRTHIESARIADPGAARKALAAGLVAHLDLIPGDSDKGSRVLLPKPG